MKTTQKQSIWTKNFILITIINFLIYSNWQMFPSALPGFVQSLGGADSTIGLINGISTVATLLVRPLSGRIMDNFGRKGIFIFGLALMLISTLGYAFFPIIGVILALRFFHGIAWGISNTASNTVATDHIPSHRMAEGMGYFALSISFSSAVAPALSLFLPIQWVFWSAAACVLLALILNGFLQYPEKQTAPETRRPQGSMYERRAYLSSVMMFLLTLTYGPLLSFVSLLAAERSVANIGWYYTVYALGMLVTRPFLGRYIEDKGYGAAIVPGAVLSAIGLLILHGAGGFTEFMVSALLYGIGYGVLYSTLQVMSLDGVASHRRGAANATFFTGYDAGMGFGSVLAGMLAAKVGYGMMFALLALCMLLLVALYYIFRKQDGKEGK